METNYYSLNFEKNLSLITKKLDIQKHIAEFLHENDELHLPGLGAIKKIRTEAGMKMGEMRPPGTKLIFSPEEKAEEKNIFPDYLAEKENINSAEAQQKFLEFIDEIKFAFNKSEAFNIDDVCSLYLDEDNNIRLDEDQDFVGDPDYYGLDSFELGEIKEEEKSEKETGKEESTEDKDFYSEKMGWVLNEDQDMHKFEETYVKGNYREPPPPPPVPTYPPETAREMRKPSGRRRFNVGLIIAGIAILIVAVLILIPFKSGVFNNDIDFNDIFGTQEEMEVNDDFSDIEDEDFNFDEMVDGLKEDLDSASEMGNALDIKEEEVGKVPEDSPEASEKYIEYHIIAGSFRDYENAKELQQELTLQGYPSLIIEPGGGIYRVSAISFRDKVTALNRLVEFREKTGMKTAWLMNLE